MYTVPYAVEPLLSTESPASTLSTIHSANSLSDVVLPAPKDPNNNPSRNVENKTGGSRPPVVRVSSLLDRNTPSPSPPPPPIHPAPSSYSTVFPSPNSLLYQAPPASRLNLPSRRMPPRSGSPSSFPPLPTYSANSSSTTPARYSPRVFYSQTNTAANPAALGPPPSAPQGSRDSTPLLSRIVASSRTTVKSKGNNDNSLSAKMAQLEVNERWYMECFFLRLFLSVLQWLLKFSVCVRFYCCVNEVF